MERISLTLWDKGMCRRIGLPGRKWMTSGRTWTTLDLLVSFFSLRMSSVSFPLSGGFWWCFGRLGPHMCLFSPSGCLVEPPGGLGKLTVANVGLAVAKVDRGQNWSWPKWVVGKVSRPPLQAPTPPGPTPSGPPPLRAPSGSHHPTRPPPHQKTK